MKTFEPDSLLVVSREEIAAQLGQLGLKSGDTVFVHSSLSSIGYVSGGAQAVVDAFLDVVGDTGTLAVPTIPYRGSMRAYLESRPLFDVRTTPSLMGAVTEAVRRHPRALRSLEPTHPVAAIGANAEFLIREHRRSESPCDRHSPYFRLTMVGAWYLLLGVTFSSCTLLHTAEELARVPFIDFETFHEVACRDGEQPYTARIVCHSAPLPAYFPAVEPMLRDRDLLGIGWVGAAECRLARASDILETALAALERDPYCLRAVSPGGSSG